MRVAYVNDHMSSNPNAKLFCINCVSDFEKNFYMFFIDSDPSCYKDIIDKKCSRCNTVFSRDYIKNLSRK